MQWKVRAKGAVTAESIYSGGEYRYRRVSIYIQEQVKAVDRQTAEGILTDLIGKFIDDQMREGYEFTQVDSSVSLHGALCADHAGRARRNCIEYVGDDDPLILKIPDWKMQYQLKHWENGNLIHEMSRHRGTYMTDIEQYIAAYQWAAERAATQAVAQEAQREAAYIEEIRGYWEWQQDAHTAHFQAHGCEKCRYYTPLNTAEDLPPCHLARDPIMQKEFWEDATHPRAPKFAVLCGEDHILPRCEAFAYRDTPKLGDSNRAQMQINGAHGRIINWIAQIADMFGEHGTPNREGLPGPLGWLNYGRGPTAPTAQADLAPLFRWLDAHYQHLGGDMALVYLVDVVIAEIKAIQDPYSFREFKLWDDRCNEERWVMAKWEYVKEAPWNKDDWPDGFIRPWEGRK